MRGSVRAAPRLPKTARSPNRQEGAKKGKTRAMRCFKGAEKMASFKVRARRRAKGQVSHCKEPDSVKEKGF